MQQRENEREIQMIYVSPTTKRK